MADEKLEENINPETTGNDDVPDMETSSESVATTNPALKILREVLPKVLAFLRKCFSIKVTHVLIALGVLIFSLFVFLLLEQKHHEYERHLIGYIKINHKVPEWHHKKELPEEAIQHLKNYEEQKRNEHKKYTVIQKDRRAGLPVLGKLDEAPLDNKTFFKILNTQDLGRITQSSIEKPENMDLSGHNLSKLDYKYFRAFIGADLRYTVFNGIEEEGLSFRGSSLSYAQFVDALIPQSNFIRTNLSFANFYSAVLDGSSFIGIHAQNVHFKEARMVAANFKESKMIDSDFSNTHLDQANFKNSFLTGTNFNNSKLSRANFKNAKLQGSSFVNCDLEGADFTNANLEGVNFTGADLLGAKFTDADVTQAIFKDAKNTTLKQLEEVKFLLSAKSIPDEIIPKKKSWLERFRAPHDSHGLRIK